MFGAKKPKRVYLDWAATTPVRPEVVKVMTPYLTEHFGNPSAVHAEGVIAKRAIEEARTTVAQAVQVRPEYITFTGGGTEGNNLAIAGLIESHINSGKKYTELEIITTRIEHPSVIRTVERLEALGVQITYVAVDEVGKVKLESLKNLMSEKTVLISLAYVNSEIGVIQPLRHIKKIIKAAELAYGNTIYFHVDAAQAPLWLTCQMDAVQADLMTLDTSKCCGPKSVGVLVRSKRVNLAPVLFGGGQENGLRSGTENVAGIVGAAQAIKLAVNGFKERSEAVSTLRDEIILYITTNLPEAILNGPIGEDRVANNINISIPGLDTEFATIVLDKHGFAVSTKSACSGAGGGESVVVKEISQDVARATSTLRITLGPDSDEPSLKKLVDLLKSHHVKLKSV